MIYHSIYNEFFLPSISFTYSRVYCTHTVVDTFSISRRYVTKVLSLITCLLEMQEVSPTKANLCSQFIKKSLHFSLSVYK